MENYKISFLNDGRSIITSGEMGNIKVYDVDST